MIPRVFVSSTYYDLKHVRERIEKFIIGYGFEPVLFESDKITYEHGKPIDQSAYYEVSLCHIMLLIIGGRYGSPTSQMLIEEERKAYDEDYISITRKELETAFKKNIPVLIFIDKNVYAEFKTYKENQELFDNQKDLPDQNNVIKKFKFAHVDDINIFRFVDSVTSNAIKTFEKVEEIEHYLKSQLAGMFYLYLESLKKKSDEEKILDSVSELNDITLRMNEMLNSVGKKILGTENSEYLEVIENQFKIVIEFFVEKLEKDISFEYEEYDDDEIERMDAFKIAKIFYDQLLKADINVYYQGGDFNEYEQKRNAEISNVYNSLNKVLYSIDVRLKISKINMISIIKTYHEKVKPFIKDEIDEEKLLQRMAQTFKLKIALLPF